MIVHSHYPSFYLTLKTWHQLAADAADGCDGDGVACNGEVMCDEVAYCDGDAYGCGGNHYCLTHRAAAEQLWRNTSDAVWGHLRTPHLEHQRYVSGIVAREGNVSGMYEVASINRVLTRRTQSSL